MLIRLFAALAVALSAAPAVADPSPDAEDLRRHIEVLASDEFQGRQPGTIGEALAAQYIAARLVEAGLSPAYEDGFYRPVALVERTAHEASAAWRAGDDEGAWASAELVAFGRTARESFEDLPVIFAGYGADLAEPDGGALAAADLAGAAVLLIADTPPDSPDAPPFRERSRLLAERGAAAVIGLVDTDEDWQAAAATYREGRSTLADAGHAPVEAIVAPAAAAAMFAAAGVDPVALAARAAQPDFAPVALDATLDLAAVTAIRPFDGVNVAARLPGSGATGETVLFLAHYDHFGLCRPEGAEDRICNGAVDNASGTAALIEIARALAEGERPVRDILFVATTAEELGLLGARALAAAPPVPLTSIVAALNLDTIAIAPAGEPVAIIGRGMTPLDPVVDEIAAELGREVDAGTGMNVFLQRQDGWALMAAGVPAIMAGGSFADRELLFRFLEGAYHQPEDELVETLELGGAAEDARLHVALGRAFADPRRYPSPAR